MKQIFFCLALLCFATTSLWAQGGIQSTFPSDYELGIQRYKVAIQNLIDSTSGDEHADLHAAFTDVQTREAEGLSFSLFSQLQVTSWTGDIFEQNLHSPVYECQNLIYNECIRATYKKEKAAQRALARLKGELKRILSHYDSFPELELAVALFNAHAAVWPNADGTWSLHCLAWAPATSNT